MLTKFQPASSGLIVCFYLALHTLATIYIYLGITLGEYCGLWSRKESMQEFDCFAALGASTHLGSDDLGASAPATNHVEPTLNEAKYKVNNPLQQPAAASAHHRDDGPFSDADDSSTTITAPSSKAHSFNLEPAQEAPKAVENSQKDEKDEEQTEIPEKQKQETKPEVNTTPKKPTAAKGSLLLAMANKNVTPHEQVAAKTSTDSFTTSHTNSNSTLPQSAPPPKKSRSLSSFFRQKHTSQAHDGVSNQENNTAGQTHGHSKQKLGLSPSVSAQLQRKPSISSRVQARIRTSSKRVSSLFQKWSTSSVVIPCFVPLSLFLAVKYN